MGHSSQRIKGVKDGRAKPKTQKWLDAHRTQEYRKLKRKIALELKQKPPAQWGNKTNLGRLPNTETRRKMSEAQIRRCVEGRHNNYKGGTSKEGKKIRDSLEYRLWREAVFKRDNWTCQNCFRRRRLHAHHILAFAKFPELRLAVNNGMTLCEECHKKTDTYLKN